jgi:hypothetical protein
MSPAARPRPTAPGPASGRARPGRDRTRAQALILGGHVRVGEGPRRAHGPQVRRSRETTIALEVEAPPPFVSRGGHQAARRLRRVRSGAGRARLPGRRVVHGRLHGPAAAAGREPRLRRGRGPRPAGRGAPPRPAGRLHGADQRPRPRAGQSCPRPWIWPWWTFRSSRWIGSSARWRLASGRWAAHRGAGQAAVRGRPPAGSRRRRPRPADPPPDAGDGGRHALGIGLKLRNAVASPITGPAGNREFFLELEVPAGLRARRDGVRSICRRSGRASSGAGRGMKLERIGFAYNPTKEAALDLRERAEGWCEVRGIAHWAAPAGETQALVASFRDRRAGRPGRRRHLPAGGASRRRRWTCRCWASTSARSASSPRSRRAAWRPSWASWSRAISRSRPGWRSAPRSIPRVGTRRARTFFALNDVAVARGSLARVCRLEVEIGPSHLATFTADGLVVSSPTGSTGYSFSAGGPIVDPTSRNLIVTPIAGYLTAIRSVVVSPRHTVRIRVLDAYDVLMSVDGREDRRLSIGDVVCVSEMPASDPVHRAAWRRPVLGSAAPEVGAAAVMTEPRTKPSGSVDRAAARLHEVPRRLRGGAGQADCRARLG